MKWFKKKEKQERQNKPKKDIELLDVALAIFLITSGIGLLVMCGGFTYATIKETNSNRDYVGSKFCYEHALKKEVKTNERTDEIRNKKWGYSRTTFSTGW